MKCDLWRSSTLGSDLGEAEQADLLDKTIQEEGHADQLLTSIAERVNVEPIKRLVCSVAAKEARCSRNEEIGVSGGRTTTSRPQSGVLPRTIPP